MCVAYSALVNGSRPPTNDNIQGTYTRYTIKVQAQTITTTVVQVWYKHKVQVQGTVTRYLVYNTQGTQGTRYTRYTVKGKYARYEVYRTTIRHKVHRKLYTIQLYKYKVHDNPHTYRTLHLPNDGPIHRQFIDPAAYPRPFDDLLLQHVLYLLASPHKGHAVHTGHHRLLHHLQKSCNAMPTQRQHTVPIPHR